MAARRMRKTERGITDHDALLAAIRSVFINNVSARGAAKAHNINVKSFHRYVSAFRAEVPDITALSDDQLLNVVRRIASYKTPSLVFDAESESALVGYVIKCAQHYYGLSITELKQLALQFAKNRKISYPKSWDEHGMAGRQWYYGFMLRHKNLSLRSPEQTSMNRVKAFCRENVDHFFSHLTAVFDEHSFGPSSIWNMDETGFSTVPTKVGKIISLKGVKRVGQITSAERGPAITLAFAVSASGNSMPPFYLFPRKKMSASYMAHASKESVGYANDSGWMQADEFVLFMQHFIKFSRSTIENPTLLLLDNHASHLSIDAIDLAVKNGVTMLSFPPHCSHQMQPLDKTVYGPVKGAYTRLHDAWMKENAGKILELFHIPMLVEKALLRGATPENIVSGFRSTGICPFDPDIFPDSAFLPLGVDEANSAATAVEQEYDEEEQRRIVVTDLDFGVAANETVSSSAEPSASSMSQAGSLSSILQTIGPMHAAVPRKKSNRGPKPQKTTILTSPENVTVLKERQQKRAAAKEKKEAAEKRKKSTSPKKKPAPKRAKKMSSSSSEDSGDLCMICREKLPRRLTNNNSIKCHACKEAFHAKCVNMRFSVYTCSNCDSDDDLE